MVASRSTGSTFTADLHSLPSDWRLVRVGSDKAPIAGKGWFDADDFSPDDAAELNGSAPPAWGLKCGPASGGVLVLDLDGEDWRESFHVETGHPITDLPATISWTSGKPGRSGHAFTVDSDWWPHLANVRAITRQWKEGDPVGPKGERKTVTLWELRWNRVQSVILGAHPETGRYRWLDHLSPADIPEAAPAPDWLLKVLLVQEHPDAATVEPTAEDADRAQAMLAKLPPAEFTAYSDWLRVGMALHHTDPGLLTAWVDWSRQMATFDEAECLEKWESFGKGHKGRPASIATLHHLAKPYGYREPLKARQSRTLAPADVDGAGQEQQDTGKAKCQDLELIRAAADQVVAEDINRSRPQYLHRLRELVEADLSVPARDDLYRREIGEAIIRRDGIESKPFVGGCELPDDDDEWLIEGLILAGALNIIGADPKAGKTLFSVALLAALLHGCSEFIGQSFTSRPETIIIVGPDQPVKLWKRQLQAVGLVEGNTLDRRIVRLWDSHNPWAATPEGIAELRQVCADHPGSLVLVDSFAKVSEKLGIDENSREAAEVLTDIERACIVHGCTPLVIHHNAKAAGRIGIVNGAALRGSAAIRANSSQSLIMTLIEPDNPKDPRRRLVTEGRGTLLIDNVIELEDNGRSWRHVCEFSEHRSAAKVEKAREKLTARQAEALHALEASSEPLTTAQVWAAAYPGEPWDKAANECKQLSRTLGQLADKRLATRHPGTANRPLWSA